MNFYFNFLLFNQNCVSHSQILQTEKKKEDQEKIELWPEIQIERYIRSIINQVKEKPKEIEKIIDQKEKWKSLLIKQKKLMVAKDLYKRIRKYEFCEYVATNNQNLDYSFLISEFQSIFNQPLDRYSLVLKVYYENQITSGYSYDLLYGDLR